MSQSKPFTLVIDFRLTTPIASEEGKRIFEEHLQRLVAALNDVERSFGGKGFREDVDFVITPAGGAVVTLTPKLQDEETSVRCENIKVVIQTAMDACEQREKANTSG